MNITFIPSPNFETTPERKIDTIVIHCISLPPGEFGGDDVIDFFTNKLDTTKHSSYSNLEEMRVSAHYFIRRDGNAIQFVHTADVAWHAGKSELRGTPDCNKYSVGIELEGDEQHPFESVQYRSLVCLCRMLMEKHPAITLDRIVGHCEIAPARKTDPGAFFDWVSFYGMMCIDSAMSG